VSAYCGSLLGERHRASVTGFESNHDGYKVDLFGTLSSHFKRSHSDLFQLLLLLLSNAKRALVINAQEQEQKLDFRSATSGGTSNLARLLSIYKASSPSICKRKLLKQESGSRGKERRLQTL